MPSVSYQSHSLSEEDAAPTASSPRIISTSPADHYPFLASIAAQASSIDQRPLSSNSGITNYTAIHDPTRSESTAATPSSDAEKVPSQGLSTLRELSPSDDEGPEDESEEDGVATDSQCMAVDKCKAASGDHRKVISHIFGRNKRCTHGIPEECWMKYCRKHYQRLKFRSRDEWKWTQLDLIDKQLNKMEEWGGIASFTVGLRNKERLKLNQENALIVQQAQFPPNYIRCRERFIESHLGSNKTFADVRALCGTIEQECERTGALTLPGFEILPVLKKAYQQATPKRGNRRANSTKATSTAAKKSKRRSDGEALPAVTDSEEEEESTRPSKRFHKRKDSTRKDDTGEDSDASWPVKRRTTSFTSTRRSE
ncbi:MAG: hypothetical protein Q9190_006275 [Brigantiaea leucoxantha]